MSLAVINQDDFAAGIVRGVAPDVMPGVGLANAVNGLFNDDGDVYRRGGSRYFTPTALDAVANRPFTLLWSGYLNGLPRMLVADSVNTRSVDPLTGAWGAPLTPGVSEPCRVAVLKDKVYLPNGQVFGPLATDWAAWTRPASLAAGARLRLCSIANRLVVAANNRIAFSVIDNPASFTADDYHELPGGVIVMGLAAIRDTLLVFTNYGLWTVTNMAYDLTDAAGNVQQALSLVTPEVSLWREAGLCEWAGQIIAPCIDRVVIVDGASAPQTITNSITPTYVGLVAAGLIPGAARVYRNHLFLPVLSTGNAPQGMYVCRLDRPVRGRQMYWPWSTFAGHAAQGAALDIALTGATPDLLLAGSDRRISSLRAVFEPNDLVASDADGTAHTFDVESRDFPTGTGQPNHLRRVRLRYTLDGAAQIVAGYSFGTVAQTYEQARSAWSTYAAMTAGTASYETLFRGTDSLAPSLPSSPEEPDRYWYRLEDQPTPADRGVDPVTWTLPTAKRVRYARVRFRTTGPVARLVLHHLDLRVRSAAHDR